MYASSNARAVELTLSAEAMIDLAAATWFRGVDLLIRDLAAARDDPRALARRRDDLGLRGGAWPLPVAWRGDAARFARNLERLPRLAEAAVLGLSRTGTWVLPETPERPETEAGRATHVAATVAFHLERLGSIARTLAGFGHRLGLEVIGVASAPQDVECPSCGAWPISTGCSARSGPRRPISGSCSTASTWMRPGRRSRRG